MPDPNYPDIDMSLKYPKYIYSDGAKVAKKKPVDGLKSMMRSVEEKVPEMSEEIKTNILSDKIDLLKSMVKETDSLLEEAMPPWPTKSRVAPIAPAQTDIALQPEVKMSLKAAAIQEGPFDETVWPKEKIAAVIEADGWRERDIEEKVTEGDILCFMDGNGALDHYEKIDCWKEIDITEELLNIHAVRILTIEGGGKKRVECTKTTSDFPDGLFSVPRNMKLKLPTSKAEAIRFFGITDTEILPIDLIEKGVPKKCFYPNLSKMSDKRFRVAFSRVFVDFAKKHLRNNIRDVIPGRGHGIVTKRGVPTKRSIHELLKAPVEPPAFLERVKARALTPTDFRYDRPIGIEIEMVCPMNIAQAQTLMPHFVRVDKDGSLRDNKGQEVKTGENGFWGLEFRILINRSELETRLMRALDAIHKVGGYVNKSCGLHVHFDKRYRIRPDGIVRPATEQIELDKVNASKHFDMVKKEKERLNKWLKVLHELLPASRRKNKYCSFENADDPHHEAVNISSFNKHGTIEVRVHSSTTDYIKIVNWIRLVETLFTVKYSPLPGLSTLDALYALPFTDADRSYWLKRHQQLNPELYKRGPKLDMGFLSRPDEVE